MEILQTVALVLAAAAYLALLRPAIAYALSRSGVFPSYKWRRPEALFSMGMASFFVLTALAALGKPQGKIDAGSLQSSLALYCGLALLLLGFLVFRNVPLDRAFGLRPGHWGRVLGLSAAALALCLPAIYAAQWATYAVLGPETEPQALVSFLMEHPGWNERLLVLAIAVVAAPVTEELLFRGCVYGSLRQTAGRAVAVAVSSVVFALIHAHPATIPALVVFAIGLALLYEATGTLWAPVAAHAAFNAFNFFGSIYWPEILK